MTLVTQLLMWATNASSLLWLLPQLIYNYRRGLVSSHRTRISWTMWCAWNGDALYTIYVLGKPLPLAYKVCVPLYFVCSTLWILFKMPRYQSAQWRIFYGGNIVLLGALFCETVYSQLLSYYVGWLAIIVWSFCSLVKLYCNAQRCVVRRLGKRYTFSTLLIAFVEIDHCRVLGLPLPTLANAWRHIGVIVLFFCQRQWCRYVRLKQLARMRPAIIYHARRNQHAVHSFSVA